MLSHDHYSCCAGAEEDEKAEGACSKAWRCSLDIQQCDSGSLLHLFVETAIATRALMRQVFIEDEDEWPCSQYRLSQS